MKKSLIHAKYKTNDYTGYGFDLHEDFSRFLDEARNQREEANFRISPVNPEEAGKRYTEKEKKGQKSWKSSLVSRWKADKKTKPLVEPTINSSKLYGTRKGLLSGPVYSPGNATDGKRWSPTSGSLTNLYNPQRGEENVIP